MAEDWSWSLAVHHDDNQITTLYIRYEVLLGA